MLTGNLLRVRVTRSNISPQLISPTSPKNLERSRQLLDMFAIAQQEEQSRQEIDSWIAELSALDVDHKIFKGFAKVLLDRAEFVEPILPIENPPTAAEVRQKVFSLAVKEGPFSEFSRTGTALSKKDIFSQVAAEYGCTQQEISRYLYSDLRTMQKMRSFKGFSQPHLLIHRYNLALCQAIVLRACSLEISLSKMDPKWLRYLFRLIKFHKLMFFLEQEGETLKLTLDGPQSLFQQSTRYGMQMALFLPGLLLVPTAWSIKGVIQWKKRKKNFTLDQAAGIKSHYQERGVWRSHAETVFEERFRKKETGWDISEGELIKLSGQRILQPDFTLKKGKKKVHLEIVGFWRKSQLKNLIADCPNNVFLLVSKRLSGDKGKIPKTLEKRIVYFAEVIPVAKVLEMIS